MSNTDFFEAIKAGNSAQVQQMLTATPELVNARNGISAVMTALYYNEPRIAALLLEKGAQLDVFDAAAVGSVDRLQTLLDGDASLVNTFSVDGFQPLGLAAFFGHLDAVKLLVERGAAVNTASRNSQNVQPIHSAAAAPNRAAMVQVLLDHGADVNAVQEGGFTPLHAAAQNGDIELIQLLIQRGARREMRTAEGQTATDLAAAQGHTEVAKRLQQG